MSNNVFEHFHLLEFFFADAHLTGKVVETLQLFLQSSVVTLTLDFTLTISSERGFTLFFTFQISPNFSTESGS